MHRLLPLIPAALVLTAATPALAAFSPASGYPRREGGESRPIVVSSPDPRASPGAGFNRADCFDSAQQVQLSFHGVPPETTDVEVWVTRGHISCADPTNRPGGASLQCWRAARWTRDQVVNRVVSLPPAAVIAAIDKQIDVPNEGPLVAADVCAREKDVGPIRFRMQILAFNSGVVVGWSPSTGESGAAIEFPTAYDLVGPSAPTLASIDAANSSAELKLAPYRAPADFLGFDVYCVPQTSSACVGSPLVAGKLPEGLGDHVCALGTASSEGELNVIGLENGKTYAVAVAARDTAANPGPLSNILCTTPAGPVPSDTVKGGCATIPGVGTTGSALGLALAVFTYAAARRRRLFNSSAS